MKTSYLLFIFLLFANFTFSQIPTIKWQKCVGGSDDDEAAQVETDWNGNILLGGSSLSNDGDIQLVSGYLNAVLITIDSSGQILSSKCYGGQRYTDQGSFCTRTATKKIIICGTTNSSDIPLYHGGFPPLYMDAYLLSVDSFGNQEWAKCYGEYREDKGFKVKECLNGGFIMAAQVEGNGGNVHGYHAYEDWWVVRTDSVGAIIWSRCMGGTDHDLIEAVCQLSNGNFVVTGVNSSSDGDVTCSTVSTGNRVVILDSTGAILRDDCYGSPSGTSGIDLIPTNDGGYFFGGSSFGNGGDVSGAIGQADIWVYKADSLGQIVWSKCYGGVQDDGLHSMSKARDGGYILTGESYSKPGNIGLYPDVMVVKIDSLGNQQWLKYLGGNASDVGMASTELPNGDVVVVATTKSIDGDLTSVPQHGLVGNNKEIWVVDLAQTSNVGNINEPFSLVSIQHEPDGFEVSITSEHTMKASIKVVDLLGRTKYESNENLTQGLNQFIVPVKKAGELNLLILSTEFGERAFKLF